MMKRILAALFFFLTASSALAAEPPLPTNNPPGPEAPYEQRDAWCQSYVPWYVHHAPESEGQAVDARPTQRVDNELNFCRLDSVDYLVKTLLELPREVREEFLRER